LTAAAGAAGTTPGAGAVTAVDVGAVGGGVRGRVVRGAGATSTDTGTGAMRECSGE